ncbi:hypothetical protein F5Y00DRAFT_23511 [Daldinia vernicosa]|uniref:uncharacterized protein n=1 Tax=Daldinia vernicosa TaxID=114800 RepID=UPI002008C766|nr:uncharacterized protein F5Y00DRAFT_23511 [Daldinia vernicosa]KAI0850974.1 hypothetical protein F5Y00DRAFT_23511 [Daldinia vernicosa]
MPSAHETFKALGSINWDDVPQDQLDTFLKDAFTNAQCIIDSIPVSSSSLQHMGLPRSATDTNLSSLPNRDSNLSDHAAQLRKEWKECKVNPRENPLGLDVYKLAAKDGKGAWFARRSVHDGFTFEKWRLGLEKEFDESLKVEGGPGAGSIRGIGADRKVVNQTVEGIGKMRVYQLSAQFPGPTSPRDFIGLLLSSDSVTDAPGTPRHFMLVSKPCVHPECPPRQGYIRGQYESVEFIREIRVEKPLRKTRSSIDLPNDEVAASMRKTTENLSREATVRSARQAADSANSEGGRKRGRTIGSADVGDDREEDDNYETMIEWLMVTRSDPGGSVPRFMIERGTPPGIAGDANKLVKWISSKSIDDLAESESESDNEDAKPEREVSNAERVDSDKTVTANSTSNATHHSKAPQQSATKQTEEIEEQPGSVGVYGMIANALNAAASVAASHIPHPFGPVNGEDADTSDLTSENRDDDESSIHSFHSLEGEGIDENDNASQKPGESSTQLTPSVTNGGAESIVSSESLTAHSTAPSHHEKELKKLEERKRKTEEKLRRAQERALAKRGNEDTESQREEAAMQKLREKHEREIAKQQEKYQRELTKLEAKRASEQKKAEERRRKALEREEKTTLAMELNKVRAERDIAHKQMEILKEQIGELQAQNTKLVARLGREGITVDDSDGSSSLGGIKRSMTDQTSDRDSRSASIGRS